MPTASGTGVPTRQQQRREETTDEIKRRSREQIARNGVGGLSLRAVARDMRISSAAIYRYFPSHADVVTALCVDSYHDLADAMCTARVDTQTHPPAEQMWAVFDSVRRWALAHPNDFALIFGTPMPGYHAPEGNTTSAAARIAGTILATYVDAAAAGTVDLSVVEIPADSSPGDLAALLTVPRADVPPEIAAGAFGGWISVVGFISTELWGNMSRIMGTTDGMFCAFLRTVLRGMGFKSDAILGRPPT
ncbi:TetR/AcrR family transcriptional regulator [Mycolicibacterium fortuitum]